MGWINWSTTATLNEPLKPGAPATTTAATAPDPAESIDLEEPALTQEAPTPSRLEPIATLMSAFHAVYTSLAQGVPRQPR